MQDIFKQIVLKCQVLAQFLVMEERIDPHMGKASYNLVFVNTLPSALLFIIKCMCLIFSHL